MISYDFTLKFALPEVAQDAQAFVDALAEAGCDDALIGVGQPGRVALDFTRDAGSAFAAVSSALRDVRKAIPGAVFIEAAPDFVGLTDVAEIAGFTRQNMYKLMTTHAATFPAAVHEGKPAIWHLAHVLEWLRDHHARDVDAALLGVAEANMRLNIAKEARSLRGAVLPRALARLVA